jgi:hypothetical protein
VDDCIKIVRKRAEGEVESFSKPRDFVILQHSFCSRNRFKRIEDLFLPKADDYLKRYGKVKPRKNAF